MSDLADRAEQAEAGRRADALDKARRDRAVEAARVAAEMCLDCGEQIPPARRAHVPGVQYCVACQQLIEQQAKTRRAA